MILNVTNASGELVASQTIFAFQDLPFRYGYSSADIDLPTGLAEGTYTLELFVQDSSGNPIALHYNQSAPHSVTMTVASDGSVTFASGETASLSVTAYNFDTDFYANTYATISGTINNPSSLDFGGGIRAYLLNTSDQSVAGYGGELPMDLAAGETTTFEYTSKFIDSDGNAVVAGQYIFCFADQNGKVISDAYYVTINEEQAYSLSVASAPTPTEYISVTTQSGYTFYTVNKAKFTISVQLKNASGYYYDSPYLGVFNGTTGSYVTGFSAPATVIKGGNTETATFNCSFPDGVTGDTYILAVVDSAVLSPYGYIVLAEVQDDTSDISDINQELEVIETRLYNLSGIEVRTDNLSSGTYIKVERLSNGSIRTSKLLITTP